MKKIFVVLVLISVLAGLVIPSVGLAVTTACCRIHRTFRFGGDTWTAGTCYGEVAAACVTPDGVQLCAATTENTRWGMACILNTTYRIVDLVFVFLMAIAVIVGLIGAFNILTAAGDAGKVNKGKDYIIYAILGVLVAVLARAIPSLVAMLM